MFHHVLITIEVSIHDCWNIIMIALLSSVNVVPTPIAITLENRFKTYCIITRAFLIRIFKFL